MDNKQQVTLPKFIWVLAGILVVCIIFLIAVQIPFSQKIETYNNDHASAESQISEYEYYRKNADTITAEVAKLEKECSEKNAKLTVDPKKTVDDIKDLIVKHGMDLNSLTISQGVPDKQGGVSASGDPLYVSTIKYNFIQTQQKIIETLSYFEKESNGAYIISAVQIEPEELDETPTSGEDSSKISTPSSQNIFNTTLTIKLYYFDLTKNTGAASKASSSSSSSEASS